jgi:hypothetical protein
MIMTSNTKPDEQAGEAVVLLPCPMCDSRRIGSACVNGFYRVVCLNCGIRTSQENHATLEDAYRVWNTRAPAAPPALASFQERENQWLLACFGADYNERADSVRERNHRFLEEALELVQACGCGASEAHQLVDYVFNRPSGEVVQEIGGTMTTLAALCNIQGVDMWDAGNTELESNWSKIDRIREKQAAKPRNSPLPESPAQSRDEVIDNIATLLRDYMEKCEQTGCDLAEKTDEVSERMYWRCDGAADAIEHLINEVLALKGAKERG